MSDTPASPTPPTLQDQFVQLIAPAAAPPAEPVAPREELIERLQSLPRRAGLPRMSEAVRREVARLIARDQRGLTLAVVAFLQRLEASTYPRRPPVRGGQLEEAVDRETQVERLATGARRLGRGATDGALVANGVLAALNGRVLAFVRAAANLPPVERDRLRSNWDPVFSILDRRKSDQQDQKRLLARREDELRQQAESAGRSAAVQRALLRLRAAASSLKKGGPQ